MLPLKAAYLACTFLLDHSHLTLPCPPLPLLPPPPSYPPTNAKTNCSPSLAQPKLQSPTFSPWML